MLADSNILLATLNKETGAHMEYVQAAMRDVPTITSEVVVEVLAKRLRILRLDARAANEEFGKVAERNANREAASKLLALHEAHIIVFDNISVLAALSVMQLHGLDYVDCCLLCRSLENGDHVATSDKELADMLGDKLWKVPAVR